jgi:hypothetical protein
MYLCRIINLILNKPVAGFSKLSKKKINWLLRNTPPFRSHCITENYWNTDEKIQNMMNS